MSVSAIEGSERAAAAYTDKPNAYFSGARRDFIACLERDPSASILEIGCGTGATGALALEHERAGRYVGVELCPQAAAQARGVLSDVIEGDVETLEFEFAPASFDALILSEVLEHLREPGEVLAKLHRFVRPGGIVLASSPNISHWRVIRELVGGHFPKAESGVFDRTHLRWFTPETFYDLFEANGFEPAWVGPVTPFSVRTQWISWATGRRFDHLFMTQIWLMGRRSAS